MEPIPTNSEQIESFWQQIAHSKNQEELQAMLKTNSVLISETLQQLLMLLETLQTIAESRAVKALNWLGIQLAEANGDHANISLFNALNHQHLAKEAWADGDNKRATIEFEASVTAALLSERFDKIVPIVHTAVAFLIRFGENDTALQATEAFVKTIENRKLDNNDEQLAIYQFIAVTQHTPATSSWAVILARFLHIFEKSGQPLLANPIKSRLAIILIRMGAYEEGLELLADAILLLSRTRTLTDQGDAIPIREMDLALLWQARGLDLCGRETEAEQIYRSHPAWTNESDNSKEEVVARLAELLIENSRLQEALDLLEENPPIDPRMQALTLALTSLIYAILNRSQVSNEIASRATSMLTQFPAETPEASQYEQGITRLLRQMNKSSVTEELDWRINLFLTERAILTRLITESTKSMVQEGLQWARLQGERAMEARWLRLTSNLNTYNRDSKAALQSLEETLNCELFVPEDEPWRLYNNINTSIPPEFRRRGYTTSRLEAGVGMETRMAIGTAKAEAGLDPIPIWNEVITVAQRRNRRLILFEVLTAKARWLHAEGLNSDAIKPWTNALDVLESLRTDFHDIEMQIGILENKETAYSNLLLVAVDANDGDGAMRLMERAKARSLLEEMTAKKYSESLSPTLKEKAQQLRIAIVRAMQKQNFNPKDNELLTLKEKLASVFRTRKNNTTLPPQTGALATDVAQLSNEEKAVLHYYITENKIIITIARDGRNLPPISIECKQATLFQLLESFHQELSTLEYCYSLLELYSILIKPIEMHLKGIKELMIIPHGILHSVPFQALRRSDEKYLIECYDIHYAPSVAIALLVGAPLRSQQTNHTVLVACGSTPYISLPVLEEAVYEVEAVANLLPHSIVLKGVDATRRQLLKQEGPVDVLHLACHGEFDSDDPLLSRIYLTDGPLYAYEIERMALCPRLTVLSACETGIQLRRAGDETFGLIRAFLVLGAEAVIASLWNVADQSTSILMHTFYETLGQMPDQVAKALRAAQCTLLLTEAYSHPFYWAPYFLTGSKVNKISINNLNLRNESAAS